MKGVFLRNNARGGEREEDDGVVKYFQTVPQHVDDALTRESRGGLVVCTIRGGRCIYFNKAVAVQMYVPGFRLVSCTVSSYHHGTIERRERESRDRWRHPQRYRQLQRDNPLGRDSNNSADREAEQRAFDSFHASHLKHMYAIDGPCQEVRDSRRGPGRPQKYEGGSVTVIRLYDDDGDSCDDDDD